MIGSVEIMQEYGNRNRALLLERDRRLLEISKEALRRITSQDPSPLGKDFFRTGSDLTN